MSGGIQTWQIPNATPVPEIESANWYAVQTRARHEKVVAERLQEQGITTFLPIMREVHRWSDRKKTVEVPLFSCYVFVKTTLTNQQRLRVCCTDGVFQMLGVRGEATPIPEEQIEGVHAILSQQVEWSNHPFLKIGQRVRIRSGALDGVEGILVGRAGEESLVVSVDVIQRSLAVRIEGYDVEPL